MACKDVNRSKLSVLCVLLLHAAVGTAQSWWIKPYLALDSRKMYDIRSSFSAPISLRIENRRSELAAPSIGIMRDWENGTFSEASVMWMRQRTSDQPVFLFIPPDSTLDFSAGKVSGQSVTFLLEHNFPISASSKKLRILAGPALGFTYSKYGLDADTTYYHDLRASSTGAQLGGVARVFYPLSKLIWLDANFHLGLISAAREKDFVGNPVLTPEQQKSELLDFGFMNSTTLRLGIGLRLLGKDPAKPSN